MTVKELIKVLNNYDENLEIEVLNPDDSKDYAIDEVELIEDDALTIWIKEVDDH